MAAASIASNDVKTGRQQQLTRQLITARVQVIASTLSHAHPPLTSKVTTLVSTVKQTCIRSTIARPPTSSTAAALKGCSRLCATTAALSWAARSTRGRGRVTGGAWWRWVVSRGEGALSVVCRSAAHTRFNYDSTDSSVDAAAWVVARR